MKKTVMLEGAHPYTGKPVTMEIQISDAVPGIVAARGKEGKHERAQANAYTALAGPFLLDEEGGVWEPDRHLLLGMVWDLAGYPLRPGLSPRVAATFCLVDDGDGRINLYRKTSEMIDSYDVLIDDIDGAESWCGPVRADREGVPA